MSLAEKREVLLQIFSDSEAVFQLKELEKIASKKGINSMVVKDILQGMADDDIIHAEKVREAMRASRPTPFPPLPHPKKDSTASFHLVGWADLSSSSSSLLTATGRLDSRCWFAGGHFDVLLDVSV